MGSVRPNLEFTLYVCRLFSLGNPDVFLFICKVPTQRKTLDLSKKTTLRGSSTPVRPTYSCEIKKVVLDSCVYGVGSWPGWVGIGPVRFVYCVWRLLNRRSRTTEVCSLWEDFQTLKTSQTRSIFKFVDDSLLLWKTTERPFVEDVFKRVKVSVTQSVR